MSEPSSTDAPVANWDRIIHKNVRTRDDQGFGQVIAVPDDEDVIIITSQSGGDQYRVPRSAVSGFNGAEVMLNAAAAEMGSYAVRQQDLESSNEPIPDQGHETPAAPAISKEVISESRSEQIDLMREELVVKRRQASADAVAERPVTTRTEVSLALSREEPVINKVSTVKEELYL